MPRLMIAAALGATFAFGIAVPRANAAPGDACSLLTPAQIKSAVGADVGAGAAGSPKLCQWNASLAPASTVKFVTLLLYSDTNAFEPGKNMPPAPSLRPFLVSVTTPTFSP
jgi:hypothetical protein